MYSGADGVLLYTLESTAGQLRFGGKLAISPATEAAGHPHLLVSCYLVGRNRKQRTPAFTCYDIGSWELLWTARIPATKAAEGGGDHSSCAIGGRLDEDQALDFFVSFVDDENLHRVRAISGIDGSTLWEIQTETGELEPSYSRFGDFDNDGCEEVLLTRLRHTGRQDLPTVWTMYVLAGKDGFVLREMRPAGVVPYSDPWGSGLARIESMDGGDVPEIAIHSWSWGIAGETQTVVISGASGRILLDIPLLTDLTWAGTDCHELITGGDANADGTPDIIARVFNYDSFGFPDEGIHVYSGRDGTELFHKTCRSETASVCDE